MKWILQTGLILLFGLYFLWPLANSSNHPGMYGQDAVAHSRMLEAFCNEFPNLFGKRIGEFYAPVGVPLSLVTDSPTVSALSCLWPASNFVSRFSFNVLVHWVLLWTILALFAHRFIEGAIWKWIFVTTISMGAFIQGRSLGHYNLFPLAWGPFALLLLLWPLPLLKLRSVSGRVALICLTFLSSWQNFPVLFPLAATLIIRQVWLSPYRARLLKLTLGSLPVALLLIGYFMGPIIYDSTTRALRSDLATAGYGIFNSDILSYIVPGPLSPAFNFVQESMGTLFPAQNGLFENSNSFAWTILFLMIFAFFRRLLWTAEFKILFFLSCFYILLSFGSEFRIGNDSLFHNPGFAWLHTFPPFSLSRTPGRYATVAIGILTYLAIKGTANWLSQSIWQDWFSKYIPGISGSTAIGTVLLLLLGLELGLILPSPRQVFVDNYKELVPLEALEIMRSSPSEGYTLQVPFAPMGDPSQNFLQGFHRHKLVNGYVSYTIMTPETLAYVDQHRIIQGLDCIGNQLINWPQVFANSENLKTVTDQVFRDLKAAKIDHLILNWALLRGPNCEGLGRFMSETRNSSNIQILEEKGLYTVMRIKP